MKLHKCRQHCSGAFGSNQKKGKRKIICCSLLARSLSEMGKLKKH